VCVGGGGIVGGWLGLCVWGGVRVACLERGELTKVVDRGTAAMQDVLSTILFQIVPQVYGWG
jgi:hypothetical protein